MEETKLISRGVWSDKKDDGKLVKVQVVSPLTH